MASDRMQKANLASATPHRHGRVRKESLTVDGVTVTRVTFDPGARWTEDVAPAAGTGSCRAPHVALVLAGTLHVQMDDGSAEDFGPNDVMLLPSGHDAWTVGDAPCVFIEFSQGYERYQIAGAAGGTTARFG
jgi:hypothetical protein